VGRIPENKHHNYTDTKFVDTDNEAHEIAALIMKTEVDGYIRTPMFALGDIYRPEFEKRQILDEIVTVVVGIFLQRRWHPRNHQAVETHGEGIEGEGLNTAGSAASVSALLK
jgi:hypothetical protein